DARRPIKVAQPLARVHVAYDYTGRLLTRRLAQLVCRDKDGQDKHRRGWCVVGATPAESARAPRPPQCR
ncbi:unnamed protein product, partial [Amoebophrya sp. A120]